MSGFLDKAARSARSNVEAWRERFPDPDSMERGRVPLFLPLDPCTCGVIAEVKMQSPSRGDLMGERDPLFLPVEYESSGACAVSVVVEEQHFKGSPELFSDVAGTTSLPLLWKDFVVDPYQIRLAAGLGASAVLLIAGMLTDTEMSSFLSIAREQGLRALVEVHSPVDLDRSLEAGADLVGINNRDLLTLKVDIRVSVEMAERIPGEIQAISESGIKSPEHVRTMAALGYRAVLVGESLVTAGGAERLLREMVEAGGKRDQRPESGL